MLPVILGLCPKRKYPPLCGGIFYCVFKRFFGIVGCDVCEGFFSLKDLLALVIAFEDGLEYACAAQKGKPNEKGARKEWNKKGITCRIPLELHNRISGEIREMGSTMGQFIEMIIQEHYETC